MHSDQYTIRTNTWQHLVAGGASGALGTIIGHPLDSIKVWLQTQTRQQNQSRLQLIYSNVNQGGYGALMKGILPASASRFFVSGIGFSLLSKFKTILQEISPVFRHQGSILLNEHLDGRSKVIMREISPLHTTCLAAALTGVCLTLPSVPLDLVKIQMQQQHLCTHFLFPYPHTADQAKLRIPNASPYPSSSTSDPKTFVCHTRWNNSLHCAVDLAKRYGWRSLFTGTLITGLRNPPFWAMYYTVYEGFTRHFNGETEVGYNRIGSMQSSSVVFAAGCLAGGVSWLLIMPLDFIKTRIQSQKFHETPLYSGIRDCAVKTYRSGGLRPFFAGSLATVARGSIVNAFIFLTFEWLFKQLNKLE